MPQGFQQQDFSFCGPAYTAADPFQDRQVLVNWYPEIDKTQGARVPIALLGCPGLFMVAQVTPMGPAPPFPYPKVPIAGQ